MTPWTRTFRPRLNLGGGRWVLASLLLLLSIGAGAFPGQAQSSPEDVAVPTAFVVAQSDEQVIFEVQFGPPTLTSAGEGDSYTRVEIPGLSCPYDPGKPHLPMHYITIALPPGTEAHATVIGGTEEHLAQGRPLPIATETYLPPSEEAPRSGEEPYQHVMDYREDETIYGGTSVYPERRAQADGSRRWRFHRISTVALHPVRYDPQAGALFFSSRMRIQVQFVPTGGDPLAERTRPYLKAEPRWEPIYERKLINYERARSYKRAPFAVRAPEKMLPDESEFEVRIRVDSTRVYAVRHEDVEATGAFSGTLDWDDLRLLVRDYDPEEPDDPFQEWEVSFRAEDNDEDGLFGTGDRVVFYGEDAWDFFDLPPGERRYLRHNVYWLVGGAGPGAQMVTTSAWLDEDVSQPVMTYERTQHFEQDRYYMSVMARGDQRGPHGVYGPFGIHTDHYNWTHPHWQESIYYRPIKVVSADLPELLLIQDICVHLQGQEEFDGYGDHHTRLWISTTSQPFDTTWAFPGNPYTVPELNERTLCVTGADAAATPLRPGRNYFKFYVPKEGDDIDGVEGKGLGLNWVEITYLGLTRMWNHELTAPFKDLAGTQQINISKCETKDMLAFDLTDPLTPAVLGLADSLFTGEAAPYQLSVQLDFGSEPSARTLYFVEREDVPEIDPQFITLRRGTTLNAFTGEDYVAIYPRRFEESLTPLLDHREEVSGHNVLRAPVEDVFDTYSGGRRHPYAIKSLLREMWRVGETPPDYLFLMGDASNDIASYTIELSTGNADSNYVPVMTIPGHASTTTAYQIVSSDHWFVDNLTGGWDDDMTFVPDMFVARLPCGNEDEVDLSVEKILDYEREDHLGDWRAHVVLHSDDAFSSRITGLGGADNYTLISSEWIFLDKTQRSYDIIRSHPAFDHYVIDTVYQHFEMDSVVTLGRCVVDTTTGLCQRDADGNVELVPYPTPVDMTTNWEYGSTVVRDLLLDYLNQGALIWAYQGHSNHKLIAHELLFQHSITSSPVDRLSNVDKPFIFGGFGCHLGEYAHHEEGYPIRGDCLAEKMLFCCSGQPRGAIAALGSTDYEWVHHTFEWRVFQAMFGTPPIDEFGNSRWHLGEIITEAKLDLPPNEEERITYTLLADPGLRVGIAPPILHVDLNGEAWTPGGDASYVSARDDDSLTVRVQVYDDSHLETGQLRIKDYRNGVYDWVPDTLITLVESDDDRQMLVEYKTQLLRRPYDLIVQGVDYEGSQREVTATIPMIVGFFEDIDGELVALPETGAILSDSTSLVLTVLTGVHLGEEDFVLRVGGVEIPILSTEFYQEEGGGLFNWTVRYDELGEMPPGDVTLALGIDQRDGSEVVVASQGAEVGDEILRFRSQYWIPNPFSSNSTLVYDLSLPGAKARVRLFTVSGWRILEEKDLPASKGVNYFQWNGRDADGDQVANGLYFYEITAWDEQGKAIKSVDKVVRAR